MKRYDDWKAGAPDDDEPRDPLSELTEDDVRRIERESGKRYEELDPVELLEMARRVL